MSVFGLALRAAVALTLAGCVVSADSRPVVVEVNTATGTALEFVPAHVAGPADTPLTVHFRNASGAAHNLVFVGRVGARSEAIVRPGETSTFVLSSLAAGTYRFVCTIHEGMEGTLTLE